jgi:ferritin-like protein
MCGSDISKCFDQIDHVSFLKLNTLPEMETQVKAWLKAGIMEEFSKTKQWKDIPENQKELHKVASISAII